MKDFYQFAGEHPFLTFLLALLIVEAFVYPFKILNRYFRSRNIKNAGWPPSHLDADGDVIKKEERE